MAVMMGKWAPTSSPGPPRPGLGWDLSLGPSWSTRTRMGSLDWNSGDPTNNEKTILLAVDAAKPKGWVPSPVQRPGLTSVGLSLAWHPSPWPLAFSPPGGLPSHGVDAPLSGAEGSWVVFPSRTSQRQRG